MSGDPLPHDQRIGQVFAQDGSHAFVGSFNNCHFPGAGSTANEQDVRACRNALYLTDPYIDRANLISAKGDETPGTCKWITQDEGYRSWLHGSTRLLWISGGPGKGKTMLSIFLTKELERTAQAENAELIFYFCSYQDDKRNTGVAVLRGLVHQILTKRPQLAKHALPYFESLERTQQSLLSLETLWIIFTKLVEDPELGTMFCVLDGLDECDQDTMRLLSPKLVSHFSSTGSSSSTSMFKLAIISRDIIGLRRCVRVRLDPNNDEKVARDVERFISTRVRELSRIEGFNDEMHATVKTALLDRSEGTFLWVGFAMNELLQKQTCSQVLGCLDDLPSGLPAIYSRMLLQIPRKDRPVSAAILRWVTVASRPLKLQELAAALQIQPSSSLITVDRAIRDSVNLVGPFLKIQEEQISLIHQSARDYLRRQEPDSIALLEEFRIKPEEAHLDLARTCLECVTQGMQSMALNRETTLRPQDNPLLWYAVLHWPDHARKCSALAAELLDLLKVFSRKNSRVLRQWWEAYKSTRWVYQAAYLPLHTACYFGIVPWTQALLLRNPRLVNEKGKHDETAIYWAAEGGHVEMMQLLVSSGADVNAMSKSLGTALLPAAGGGHMEMSKFLINNGANVNVAEKNGWTALLEAAAEGYKELVQLLIDSGADVNLKTLNGFTALHRPAIEGYESIVQLLVNNGADVNAKVENGETALCFATRGGYKRIVQLLLDGGADASVKYEGEHTALHLAAYHGFRDIVQLLIDHGADIRAMDNNRVTALEVAAYRGHREIVQLLIDNGADVTEKDSEGRTALHRAASQGNREVVQLLIESRTDMSVRGKRKHKARQLVSGQDLDEIVDLLNRASSL